VAGKAAARGCQVLSAEGCHPHPPPSTVPARLGKAARGEHAEAPLHSTAGAKGWRAGHVAEAKMSGINPDPASFGILAQDPGYNATLAARIDDTDTLARVWIKPTGTPTPFEPGQYVTIGVKVGEKWMQRPYSIASSARDTLSPTRSWWRVHATRLCTSSWAWTPRPRTEGEVHAPAR